MSSYAHVLSTYTCRAVLYKKIIQTFEKHLSVDRESKPLFPLEQTCGITTEYLEKKLYLFVRYPWRKMQRTCWRVAIVGIVFGLLLLLITAINGQGCQKQLTPDGFVCVCNEQKCDTLQAIGGIVHNATAVVFETSQSGKAFERQTLAFQTETNDATGNVLEVVLNPDQVFQEILGFGGALTDAAGINIESLSPVLQRRLMRSYFSKEGSEYSIVRIPIASTDFSTHQYSYDDVEDDFELKHFSLAKEDLLYKIPYAKEAMALTSESGNDLKFISSSWSSPFWMKTTNNMTGGQLKSNPPGMYETAYANYFVKFYQHYLKEGIRFWGTTVQNEPSDGFVANFTFQSQGFDSFSESNFLGKYLGPALKNSGFQKLKIMVMDDQRIYLPEWVDASMNSAQTKPFVSGVAFHWYFNEQSNPTDLDKVKQRYPQLFLLASEACNGGIGDDTGHVIKGSWVRGESYAVDIMTDLLHWTSGWMDWNLAVDMIGGPNWSGNFVDAPILVDADKNEFYKQPTYYCLAHFSKLIRPGAFRIEARVTDSSSPVQVVALRNPDKSFVVHALNVNGTQVTLRIKKPSGNFIENTLPPHTLQSFVFE